MPAVSSCYRLAISSMVIPWPPLVRRPTSFCKEGAATEGRLDMLLDASLP
jgi:hypothetical protein